MAQPTFTQRLPQRNYQWMQPNATPTELFANWAIQADALLRSVAAGNYVSLFNAVNDAAAAAGGVAIGQLYRNGNAVQIRLV